MEADYNEINSSLSDAVMEAYKQYNLDPFLSSMYRKRYKFGGNLTVKQRNRYKNEPSEDI